MALKKTNLDYIQMQKQKTVDIKYLMIFNLITNSDRISIETRMLLLSNFSLHRKTQIKPVQENRCLKTVRKTKIFFLFSRRKKCTFRTVQTWQQKARPVVWLIVANKTIHITRTSIIISDRS